MIPRLVHFIFGLEELEYDFLLVHYLAILSASRILKPEKIIFHHLFEPSGHYWEKIKPLLELRRYKEIQRFWGEKRIQKRAHLADALRLKILEEEGGIYLDMDTICVQPIDDLLRHRAVLGLEDSNSSLKTGICNAIMLFQSGHPFLKRWREEYESHFRTEGWNEASSKLPLLLYEKEFKDQDDFLLTDSYMFFSPAWDQPDEIFSLDRPFPSKLRILHLWESVNRGRINEITEEKLRRTHSLYAKIVSINGFLEEKEESFPFWKIYRDGEYGKSKTRRYYSGDLSDPKLHSSFFSYLSTLLESSHFKRVIDLGCGDGRIGAMMASLSDVSYLGVDLVEEILGENRLVYPDLQFTNEFLLPEANSLIICFRLFSDLSEKRRRKMFEKLQSLNQTVVIVDSILLPDVSIQHSYQVEGTTLWISTFPSSKKTLIVDRKGQYKVDLIDSYRVISSKNSFIAIFREFPDYDYYWFLEENVRIREIVGDHLSNSADLLATEVNWDGKKWNCHLGLSRFSQRLLYRMILSASNDIAMTCVKTFGTQSLQNLDREYWIYHGEIIREKDKI